MRWLADECVAAPLVGAMRAHEFDVLYIAESAAGATDHEVAAQARAENRLLLTEDKDFGELLLLKSYLVPGLVLLRLERSVEVQWARLEFAVTTYGEGLFGRLTVIETTRIRSRPIPPA